MNLTFANSIQERLREVEALIATQVESGRSGPAAGLYQLIASGGKRIRPRLALLTGGMLGANRQKLVILAAAIELLHTATLIHDDLVDHALLRRGIPTLNAHYSTSITVLTGDFGFAKAARLASETGSNAVMRLFAETLVTMTQGELTQATRKGHIPSREEYFQRIFAKTASMFELATGAAALLSPVGEGAVAHARQFGYQIGMAFQIVDDILDFTGDPAVLGKPTGSDLRQGMVTLPALCYFETHPGDPLACLAGQAKSKKARQAEFDILVADIRKNGATRQALQEAEAFVQRGLAALAFLPNTPERQELAELAQSIVRV